uniref:RRM domain-containing protein n=1 Tax=Parascaris equorum TaxID=6256 RepID=A0A914RHZ3_PAREQ
MENLELPIASGKFIAGEMGKIDRRKYFQDAKRKGWRLIMRNIAFNDPRYPQSCAGFAFIQFNDRKDAKNAMQSLNMSEINGRKVAVDWAIDKDTYESANFEGITLDELTDSIYVFL